jgi:hypothetical protein
MTSVIVIRVNGVDITDDVIFADAEFNSQVSGSPGTCLFRLKDMEYAYSFVVGQTITLDIDEERVWGGWVQSVKRQYFFPYASAPGQRRVASPSHYVDPDPCGGGGGGGGGSSSVAVVPRALVIEGVDYNILFRKRFCYDKKDPLNTFLKSWPEDTSDKAMIEYLCGQNLDLSGDGIDFTSMVENVGTPNPDTKGNPVSAGQSWEDAMNIIARYPGAIYYIDPDKHLVYTDVDTPNADYKLTDTPSAPDELGYREMEILFNGSNLVNDAMVWGAGQGAKRVKFSRTRDEVSIDAHGLWQVGDFRGDMWRQASVDKRSQSFVYGSPQNKRGGRYDAVSVMVSLFQPVFRVSEKVDFKSNVYDITDVYPIRRMKVTFVSPTEARFDLVLSHSIDEPWNTFEYWFPKIKMPEINIPPWDPYNTCPTPQLGSPTWPPLVTLIPVFSDDFARASGQPNDSTCGVWKGDHGPLNPTIVRGRGTPLAQEPKLIYMKNPVGGLVVILAAFSPHWWIDEISQNRLWVFAGNMAVGMYANGDVLAGGQVLEGGAALRSVFSRPFYMRAVFWSGVGVFLKVWRQGFKEPFNWTFTAVSDEPGRAVNTIDFRANWEIYLQGISVWSSIAQSSSYDIYDPPHVEEGWIKSFPFEDPADGRAYAISWGRDALYRGSGGASHSIGIVWGYFGPDYGPGATAYAETRLTPFYIVNIMPYWYGTFDDAFVPASPVGVKINGKVSVGCGQYWTWVGANRQPVPMTIGVEIKVVSTNAAPGWQAGPLQAEWELIGGSGPGVYWPGAWSVGMAHRTIWSGSIPYVANETGLVTLEWEAELDSDDFGPYGIEPGGGSLNYAEGFCLAVSIYDPVGLLSQLDPSGGPFMFPNDGSISASLSDLIFRYQYAPVICGSHFCVPASSGGDLGDERTCDVIAIDSESMRRTIEAGENWAVKLRTGYKPGSVAVWVDGQQAKAALDYVELDHIVGTISFLNNFSSANLIEVCYLPDGAP